MSEIRCKRCNRILTAKESIERGYGLKCYRIIQLQQKKPEIKKMTTEINFLKCEINFLKKQFRELKARGIPQYTNPIERIKPNNNRPEQEPFKIEFNMIIQELKMIFTGENFNYHEILKPIEPRTDIENSPILEEISIIN